MSVKQGEGKPLILGMESKPKKMLSQADLQALNQGLDKLIVALDGAIEEARLTTQAFKGTGGEA